MKFITSFWGIALIGLIMNLLVVSWMGMRFLGKASHLAFSIETPVEIPVVVAPNENDRYWTFRSAEVEDLSRNLMEEKTRLSIRKAELMALQERIQGEKMELEKLKTDIQGYEGQLDQARQKLEEARKAFEDEKKKMAQQYIQIEQGEQKNLKSLATAYTNLTPAAAVGVFKEMEDVLAVKILSQMKPDVVAAIFEEMVHTVDNSNPKDPKPLAKRVAVLSDKLRLLQPLSKQ